MYHLFDSSLCLWACDGIEPISTVPDPPTLVQAFPEHGVSGLRLIIWVRLEPNDDVQYYELTYDSVHVDHPIAPETLRVENTGSSAIQVRVQGLRRLTEYRFAVRAVSSHGVASQATSTTATTEGKSFSLSYPSLF